MAAHQHNEIPVFDHPDVTRQAVPWGWIFTGTRDALVAAGVATPAPFPGDPDARRTAVRTTAPDGWPLTIRKRSARRFDVWRTYSELELQRWERQERERQATARKARFAACMPKTAAEFRAKELDATARVLWAWRRSLEPTLDHGFGFDEPTLSRMDAAAAQMLLALRNGRVIRHPKAPPLPEEPRRARLVLVKRDTPG